MSTQPSTGRVRSIYEFIKAHRDQFSAQMVCRVLGVAPSGYYAWLQQPISNRAQEDARPLRLIRASFIASHGIYGAPRVFLDLREAGETCSKHRCCAADARSQSARPARLSHAALGSREAVGADPQPAAATIHRDAPQQGVGYGYHLYSDLAGLALPGRRNKSVLRGVSVRHRVLVMDAVCAPESQTNCRNQGSEEIFVHPIGRVSPPWPPQRHGR